MDIKSSEAKSVQGRPAADSSDELESAEQKAESRQEKAEQPQSINEKAESPIPSNFVTLNKAWRRTQLKNAEEKTNLTQFTLEPKRPTNFTNSDSHNPKFETSWLKIL